MRRDEKAQVVDGVRTLVKDAHVIVQTDFTGSTVEEITRLRRKVREAKGVYRVVKNTLAVRAFEAPGMEGFREGVRGPSGFAFGFDDDAAVGVCKALKDFEGSTEHFKIKAGVLDGKSVNAAQIKEFAGLPGRKALVARLLGVLQSPMRNLVTVLSAPLRNLVLTVKATADKREKEQPAGTATA